MKQQKVSLSQLPQTVFVVILLFLSASSVSAQNIPEFAQNALDKSIYLEMKDKDGNPVGTGNGFFVAPNLIATNPQIIEGAASGTVKLHGNPMKYEIEGITAVDEENNLMILKTAVSVTNPPPIIDSDVVKSNDIVYITGSEKGIRGTMSDNVIVNLNKGKNDTWFQIKNHIFPGSSGGPAINIKGEVVGVFFLSLEYKQRDNFIIPSKYLKQLIAQSKQVRPISDWKQIISAETYFRWGYITASLRDLNQGITFFSKAIELKPNYINAYINRGVAYDQLKMYEAAISDYDTVIHLNPDNLMAYNNRGISKANLGQYDDAIKDYDKVIQIDDKFLAAYGNRGRAKTALEQFSDALSDYNTVLRLRPDDVIVFYNRGDLYYKMKKYEDAISDFSKAILLKPGYIMAYYGRGLTKEAMGRTIEAKLDFQSALDIIDDKESELKAKIKKALQQLNSTE